MSTSDVGTPAVKGSRRRRLLLAAGTLLFSFVLIAGLEGVLRLTGLGRSVPWSASRLKYQHYAPPLLRPAQLADGTVVLRTVDPRLAYQTMLATRATNSLRVLCFGGSATAGLGFSPNVTYARALEDMLVAAMPDRAIEVINLGIVAFSSGQVGGMVAESCARYEPDLVIVYSGNNEFLEIHASKYARVHGGRAQRLRDGMANTNLYRLVRRSDRPGTPSTVNAATESDQHLSEAELVKDIAMSAADLEAVRATYESNIDALARGAAKRGVPLLLMSVASNWEWRGRSDLPAGWIQELLGAASTEPLTDELRKRAIKLLDERVGSALGMELHNDLFSRAELHAALGDWTRAASDYRAAMNTDPHLRRALDAMNECVVAVAQRHAAGFLDTVELLAQSSEHGVVGFDEFYDYVHMTPLGRLRVAAGVFEHMRAIGLVPEATTFDAEAFVATRRAEFEGRAQDFFEAQRWLGFCDDPAMLRDRDLWKYDKMLQHLDELIAADGADIKALIWRGNARAFRQDGAAGAADDYRAALALNPELKAVSANLERLLQSRPQAGAASQSEQD